MHVCSLNMQIEYYSPVSGGAIATVIMQHSRNFVARGHRASVLTMVNDDETYRAGEVVAIRAAKRDDLSFLQRRISDVRQRIHGWDYPYYEHYLHSFIAALKRLSPAPDVVVVHNDLVSPKYIKKALPATKVAVTLHNEQRTNQRDKQKAVSYADLFLPVSGYICDWTAKKYNIPTQKLVCIGNGVDLEVFKPREDYLSESDTLRVLFIGRIDPNKGPDIAADAVTQLKKEGYAVSLTVVGGLWFYGHGNEMACPYFRSLKTKMDACNAHYLGHVTRADVPTIVREHDVVCVLSRSQEPFSLAALEAMASGCAVIASNRGGLPEACGGAAMLVDPDNFQQVVDCLRALAEDSTLLRSFKRKSVARASTESWMSKTAMLERVFQTELGLN